jgi:hypothetical protein
MASMTENKKEFWCDCRKKNQNEKFLIGKPSPSQIFLSLAFGIY